MSSAKPLILGIDPGYDRIGWAIGEGDSTQPKIVDFGCITSDQKNSLAKRYLAIEDQLNQVLAKHHPQILAIEQLFFSRNTTTALKVSEARGVILSCCARQQLEIFEYHPNQIKLAVTGHGQADKAAVEKMVRLQLKLPQKKIIDDTIDAIAIILTHAVTRR